MLLLNWLYFEGTSFTFKDIITTALYTSYTSIHLYIFEKNIYEFLILVINVILFSLNCLFMRNVKNIKFDVLLKATF